MTGTAFARPYNPRYFPSSAVSNVYVAPTNIPQYANSVMWFRHDSLATVSNDSSYIGTNLFVTGSGTNAPTYVDAYNGYYYNGGNFGYCANNALGRFTSSTWSVWVKLSNTVDYAGLLMERTGTGIAGINESANNAVAARIFPDACLSSNQTLSTGNWVHICFTASTNDKIGILYINGVSNGSVVLTTIWTNTDYVYSGYDNVIITRRFKGNIDDELIYNTALTSNEVLQLYQFGHGTLSPPYYFFNTPIMTNSNAPSPNVASASQIINTSYDAWAAMDSIWATAWATLDSTVPAWWMYDAGAGNSNLVRELIYNTTTARGMKSFYFQGSQDSTNWTTMLSETNGINVDALTNYSIANPAFYRFYRLYITSMYDIRCGCWDILLSSGNKIGAYMSNSNSPSPYRVTASSEYSSNTAWKAFDGRGHASTTTNGLAWFENISWPATNWIKYDFGSNVLVNGFDMRPMMGNDFATKAGPKTFTFDGSINNAYWITIQTSTSVPNTYAFLSYTNSNTNLYRYYRLTFTNGWYSGGLGIEEIIWRQYSILPTNAVVTNRAYYYDSITMSANTSPSPNVASASSEYSVDYQAWKAMDRSATSGWAGANSTVPAYWTYDAGVNSNLDPLASQNVLKMNLNSTNANGNFVDISRYGVIGTNINTTFTDNIYTNKYGQLCGRTSFNGIDSQIVIGDNDQSTFTNGLGGDSPFYVWYWCYPTNDLPAPDGYGVQVITKLQNAGGYWEWAIGTRWASAVPGNGCEPCLTLTDKSVTDGSKYVMFYGTSWIWMKTNRWNFICWNYLGKTNATYYCNHDYRGAPIYDNLPNFTNLTEMTVITTNNVGGYVSMTNSTSPVRIGTQRPEISFQFYQGELGPIGMGTGFISVAQAQYIMTNTIPTNHLMDYAIGNNTNLVTELDFLTYPAYGINLFALLGSQDGANWTPLLSTNGPNIQVWTNYPVANPSYYRYYQLYINSVWGSFPYLYDIILSGGIKQGAYMSASNTPSSYNVYCNTYQVNYDGYKAFDGIHSTVWYAGNSHPNWLTYDFGSNIIVNGFTISGYASYVPKDFLLDGSLNNTNWTIIDTGIMANNSSYQSFTNGNTIAYRYYRLTLVTGYNVGPGVNEIIWRKYSAANPVIISQASSWTDTNNPALWLHFIDTNTTDSSGNNYTFRPYPPASPPAQAITGTNQNGRIEYSMIYSNIALGNNYSYGATNYFKLYGTNEWTFSCWFKSKYVDATKNISALYSCAQDTTNGFTLGLAKDGSFTFADRELNKFTGTSENLWFTNQWTHFAATFKSGEQRMYCNGILVATNGWVKTFRLGRVISQVLGGEYAAGYGVAYLLDGQMNDVKFYEKVVSSNDIYNAWLNSNPTNSLQNYDVGSPWGYWPMTAGSTNLFQILSYVNGTLANLSDSPDVPTGPTKVTTNGVFYSLDAADDKFIDLTTNSVYSCYAAGNDKPFALSLWLFPTNGTTYFAGKDTSVAPNREWYAYLDSSYLLYVVICSEGDVSTRLGKVTTGAIGASNWNHIVVQYSGSKAESGISIWTNGFQAAVGTFSAGSYVHSTNGSARFCLGGRDGTLSQGGAIDDARWYTNTLTAKQISNLALIGRTYGDISTNIPGQSEELFPQTLRLTLNTIFGGNFPDTSGNGFVGTNSGGTFQASVYTSQNGVIVGNLYFDGIDDLVTPGDSDLFTFSDGTNDVPFTIMYWANQTNDNAYAFYVSKQNNVSGTNYAEWAIWENFDLPQLALNSAGLTTSYCTFAVKGGFRTNLWQFWAYVYHGKTNCNIYLNYSASPPYASYTALSDMNITTSIVNYVRMYNTPAPLRIGAPRPELQSSTYNFPGIIHSFYVVRGLDCSLPQLQYVMTNTIPTNYKFRVNW